MKIVTLNPPFFEKFSKDSRSPGVSKGGCVYYPIWLGYCTGLLEKQGHEVKLIDSPAEGMNLEKCLQIVKEFNPRMIVVQTVTASFNNDIMVVEELKKILPNVFIALVGDHTSAVPIESLKASKFVDCVTIQEFDFTVRDIAIALEQGKDISTVRGIVYRKINSDVLEEFKFTLPRELISGQDLDEFPFVSDVYKRHLTIENYFYPSVLYPEVTIITGRGCKYRCTFCKWPQTLTMHEYRARSVKNVVDEFEWIEKNLPQVKDIMIEDDTLTQDKTRTIELCKEVVARGLKIPWTCNSRADIDLETMEWMKKANCRLMCVGFESADQQILNNIKKGTMIPKIKQFVVDAKKAGILIHGCFMLGNKGETKETIKKTVAMAKELDPDTAQFFPIMVYPGTEAYKWAEENNFLKTKDWSKWLLPDGTHNSIVSTDKLTSEELVRECDKARIAFYLRPAFIFRKLNQVIKNPLKEFPRFVISTWIFSKYLAKEVKETIFPTPSSKTTLSA